MYLKINSYIFYCGYFESYQYNTDLNEMYTFLKVCYSTFNIKHYNIKKLLLGVYIFFTSVKSFLLNVEVHTSINVLEDFIL